MERFTQAVSRVSGRPTHVEWLPSFPADYIDAPRAPTNTHPGALAPRRAPFPWGRPDIPAEGSARISRPPKGPCYLLDLILTKYWSKSLVLLP